MGRTSLTKAASDDDIVGALRRKQKAFRDITVLGAQKECQIVNYDQDQLGSLTVLLSPWSRGSIFRRARIWWQVLAYLCIACSIACVFYFLVSEPAKINDAAAGKLSTYFNMFLPFLFGIYLNNIFKRWWTMRVDGLGAMNNSLNDMSLMMASQVSGPGMKEAEHLLLRYGLLSHELVYRASRKTDSDLSDLVSSGALRADECGLLQELSGASSKAQAVWVWIQLLWDGLYRCGHIPPQVHLVLLDRISAGRTGVKRIFTILSTQLPFAYVHLMACLVHLNLLFLAFQAGICGAKALGTIVANHTARHGASTVICTQIVYLSTVPFLYLGFLELAQEISDPFGTDRNDFPRAQIHNIFQDESESILKMAEAIPPALAKILEEGADDDSGACRVDSSLPGKNSPRQKEDGEGMA